MMQRNRLTAKTRAKSDHRPVPAHFARQEHRRNLLKASIARAAARLIAEGLIDFAAAKHKAARQHGVTGSQALPANHEIERALREYHALFACETQTRALSAMRDAAIRLMRWLEHFSPWLVGSVLSGTANEFSEIELELIGVGPKDFEVYLLNAGVEFKLFDTSLAKGLSPTCKQPVIKYRFEFDGAPVTVALYEHQSARQAVYPRESIRHDRAQRNDAERRFLEERGKS